MKNTIFTSTFNSTILKKNVKIFYIPFLEITIKKNIYLYYIQINRISFEAVMKRKISSIIIDRFCLSRGTIDSRIVRYKYLMIFFSWANPLNLTVSSFLFTKISYAIYKTHSDRYILNVYLVLTFVFM